MSALLHRLPPHERDIGFPVKRLLPAGVAQTVGPFIFFDHMGPATFATETTQEDVRPHPHIGLSTFTDLFSGALMHRDSLGMTQRIEPGAVNWMTAGRGVVHSEHIPEDIRAAGHVVEGIQMWLAVPADREESDPGFRHYPAADLPVVASPGARFRVLAGAFLERISPVQTEMPTLCVAGELEEDTALPLAVDVDELAVYVASGALDLAGQPLTAGRLAVLDPQEARRLPAHTTAPTRVMLIGGQRLEGRRFILWNFVATRRERIDAAKIAWAQDEFPRVPGETERIPLPD
ncbi:MAG: pirin family protein [Candidatus Competibacteraceae bacterium]|nr:pirin family protein [Candidatus Competibacteraceae bacterium]